MDQQSEDYLGEVEQRLDVLAQWAISYWPRTDAQIAADDFDGVKLQFMELVRAKLVKASDSPGAENDVAADRRPANDDSEQYINMNPAPWP